MVFLGRLCKWCSGPSFFVRVRFWAISENGANYSVLAVINWEIISFGDGFSWVGMFGCRFVLGVYVVGWA